ncbi:MAG TPA: site-specific integrase [Acidimicrobiales bacterium]|nr:site-specific integrase [Acidimicrobiales bacterium]
MRERSAGHWELRVFISNDPATGKSGRATQTFVGTEKAAGKALSALVAKVESGKFDRTTATVGQLLDKWLEFSETNQRQRPRTIYENRAKIEKRLRPRLGHFRLDRLKPDVIDAAYGDWLAEGLSPATVSKYHAILSAALRQAVKWDWIDRAPTDRATPPSLVRREMVVPTPEQLVKLVSAAEKFDPVLASAIGLAALTGMRRGELVALRWSDIDLVKGRMKVSRSLTVAGGEQHIGPTKTHASRELALDPVCVRVLKFRWTYAAELAEIADSPLDDDPYVLSYNANGELPVNPDTLTHRFGSLCRKMEEPAIKRLQKVNPKATRDDLALAKRWSFRFHDLRHFSVTTLIAAGVDIRTVAERHGHARATMTLDLYAHALPERDREAAGILGRALNW